MPTEAPAAALASGTTAPAPASVITTGKGSGMEPVAIGITTTLAPQDAEGNVMVKPVAAYLDAGTGEHKNVGQDAYPVSTTRAADLFANGLVEYDTESDMTKAVEAKVKTEADAIRSRRQVR